MLRVLLLGWRSRLFALASALAMYVVVTAVISVGRIQDQQRVSSAAAAAAEGERAAQRQPRNLAAVVIQQQQEKQQQSQQPHGVMNHMSPRRLRSRLGPKIEWCRPPLRFRRPPGGTTVGLASFPGSGNTWLRYLLQQATGLATGSVYKDYALLKNGFPGENVTNGSVIAVKTHEFGPDALKQFDKAILLVRDPFDSLKAEFNRRSGGHVGHASAEKYKRNNGKYWRTYVTTKGEEWERMNAAWKDAFEPGKLHLVLYDDLIRDTEGELRKVLAFLGEEAEEGAIACTLGRQEGIYKRTKKPMSFDVFDDGMRAELRERRRRLYGRLGFEVPEEEEETVAATPPEATPPTKKS